MSDWRDPFDGPDFSPEELKADRDDRARLTAEFSRDLRNPPSGSDIETYNGSLYDWVGTQAPRLLTPFMGELRGYRYYTHPSDVLDSLFRSSFRSWFSLGRDERKPEHVAAACDLLRKLFRAVDDSGSRVGYYLAEEDLPKERIE